MTARSAPIIHRLTIERFRGIKAFCWHPAEGVNVILGGGNVGKTTILEAIGLVVSPSGSTTLSDTDYYLRNIDAGFAIEGVLSLPPECGINDQYRPAWPWNWTGTDIVVPATDDDEGEQPGRPVYRLRVRGTADLEIAHEIVQPDGSVANLSVGLRRAIGLVRRSGDDRNDRDLRLVQGSALDRLLSDQGLRSRLAHELADSQITDKLSADAKTALESLDRAFEADSLPNRLDIAVTGSQGFSIAALVGLTAALEGVQLPLASWGAGTRRLAALAIAGHTQANAPVTLVDEVERGLEPYRQRFLMRKLQDSASQVFVVTHSPTAISAASMARLWYVDHAGTIGPLASPGIDRHRAADPETFLSCLTVVAEGNTEKGFLSAFLQRALASPLEQHGVHIADGGGHETALGLLESLAAGGLLFGSFVDNEGRYDTRWNRIADGSGSLLFRWSSGCTEDRVISTVPEERLEDLIADPEENKTGRRLRSLQERLNTPDKNSTALKAATGDLRRVIIEAAKGVVPHGREAERKHYQTHGQDWFKTEAGGRELADKMFTLAGR